MKTIANFNSSLSVTIALLLAGCATTHPLQIHEDPKLPPDQCATIVTSPEGLTEDGGLLVVEFIDGKFSGIQYLDNWQTPVRERRVTPGVHELLVRYSRTDGTKTERASRLVAVDAKAGHTYVPRFTRDNDKAHIWVSEEPGD